MHQSSHLPCIHPSNGSMSVADPLTYTADLCAGLRAHWPRNRLANIVCHGHSVPAGYFATPFVDTFNAHPHLLHRRLKARFPYAVINVIVTAIGGEHSLAGAERFAAEALCHRPRVITLDYGLNDRGLGLDTAEKSWRTMIELALARDCLLILLTPTPDRRAYHAPEWQLLRQHADQIRRLAAEYEVALADSLAAFERALAQGTDLLNLMSWANHPNRRGHQLVADEIARWFPA